MYLQIEKQFKDDQLGHLAKFKNAQVYYFSGEYEWCQAQLKVLKASIRAYQRNLNTHSSYRDFRKARAIQRDNLDIRVYFWPVTISVPDHVGLGEKSQCETELRPAASKAEHHCSILKVVIKSMLYFSAQPKLALFSL